VAGEYTLGMCRDSCCLLITILLLHSEQHIRRSEVLPSNPSLFQQDRLQNSRQIAPKSQQIPSKLPEISPATWSIPISNVQPFDLHGPVKRFEIPIQTSSNLTVPAAAPNGKIRQAPQSPRQDSVVQPPHPEGSPLSLLSPNLPSSQILATARPPSWKPPISWSVAQCVQMRSNYTFLHIRSHLPHSAPSRILFPCDRMTLSRPLWLTP